MKIIIDIDETIYHRFAAGFANEDDAKLIEHLFKNGIPLPKGHGELIDKDIVLDMMNHGILDEDAKQASIPYTYNAPQHDWKCGYPLKGGRE